MYVAGAVDSDWAASAVSGNGSIFLLGRGLGRKDGGNYVGKVRRFRARGGRRCLEMLPSMQGEDAVHLQTYMDG